MCAVAEKTLLTPDVLLSLPEQKGYELVDGEIVERKVSVLSSWVGGEIFGRIRDFCSGRDLGWAFPADNGFQCFPNRPRTVRRPDVSFVKAGRITWDDVNHGWLGIVPDLVVEVLSPNDLAYEVDEKIEMFRKAGVPLIWIVNPVVRTVRLIRGVGPEATLREGDTISGEDVIPGFACPVASIFPPRPPAPMAEVAPGA